MSTLLIFAAVECGIVFAFCRLPEKGHWKIWTASLLLAAVTVAAVYFPVAAAYEKTFALSIHVEACNKAEELIHSGKKAQLRSALQKDRWNDCVGMTQIEIAEAFLKQVNAAEGKQ